jgi:pimeloyl-ACP methyl ester carboxylesterase
MFKKLHQLKYGMRVLLSKGGGEPETIEFGGKSIVILHGGKGPPFLYLHSSLGESILWFPFFQALAKHFHVLVPTHPGFGQSTGIDQIETVADMAFHYVELLDALGIDEEIVLGGASLGGWIAAEFAVRWPERVKKLWLADAPGLWVPEQPMPDMFRYLTDRQKLRQLLFANPDSPTASLVIREHPNEQQMLYGYQAMTTLARLVWERPYDPKLAARLYRVQCPTLLLWGEQDCLVPPAYGEAYKKHIPQAELKLIPNCGHLPMFECEAEFVRTLVEFAKGRCSAAN